MAQEINEKKVSFSEHGDKELRILGAALREILTTAIAAFVEDDIDIAYKVEPLEEWIDVLCDEMKSRHVTRLKDGICSLSQGFVFNDIITNFERVADHCSNIAIAIIELEANEFDAHGYLLDLKELRSHGFDELYQEYSQKYSI